jgi:glycosyltransferase involved in cell wall biosynthesis
MRILQAPSNIANQAWGAAQGLRSLGHEVEVWQHGTDAYGFPNDRTIDVNEGPERLFSTFLDALDKDFDVYHFHYGRSLVPPIYGFPWFWDLPIIRGLGKTIVFTFHGSDVRLRSRHLESDPWSYFRFADVPCDEEQIERRLEVIRTFAHSLVVAGVLNLEFVPDASYVPKLIDVSAYRVPPPVTNARPLVVHVPSAKETKGTAFVVKGLEALEAKGMRFDHRLAEGLPHDELVAMYSAADVVVDNLLLGDCEVSSLEAMALGKPVVTRIRDEVRRAHPDLPVVDADPDTFVDRLGTLIGSARRRRELGEQGRAFVEATHDAPVVAARLVKLYEQPHGRTNFTFPGWVPAPSSADHIPERERRIRDLEARSADLQHRRDEKQRQIVELRRTLERSTPIRTLARKVVRRARKRVQGSRAKTPPGA